MRHHDVALPPLGQGRVGARVGLQYRSLLIGRALDQWQLTWASTGYSSWTHSSRSSSSVMGVKGSIWMQWMNSTLPPNQVP